MAKLSRWNQQEIDYVAAHYAIGSTKAIAEHTGKSERQVMRKAYELGLKKSKNAKGRRSGHWMVLDEIIELIYADWQNQDICDFLGIKRADLISRAVRMGLKKSDAAMQEVIKVRTKNFKDQFRFQPGLVPWNKGMRGFDPVLGRGLYRPGNKSPNALPVGTLRVRKPGKKDDEGVRSYLEQKYAEPSDWRRVHRIVWEKANGPVQDGYIVVFKPGMHTIKYEEITLDKLECISRIELAQRNHPMNQSAELARIYQLKSAISRQVNRINREHEQKS